jgi:hypothetical protein
VAAVRFTFPPNRELLSVENTRVAGLAGSSLPLICFRSVSDTLVFLEITILALLCLARTRNAVLLRKPFMPDEGSVRRLFHEED